MKAAASLAKRNSVVVHGSSFQLHWNIYLTI